MADVRAWRPGSFTKNYSWGRLEEGLSALHQAINLGFNRELADVPRELFRQRIAVTQRPDFIPMNFFLFNKPIGGEDFIIVDELVFQAITAPPSRAFDKLALFAFNLSMAGKWTGARAYQRWPALWSHYYVKDRVAARYKWDMRRVSADDIEAFIEGDARYRAEGARKVATNLNYLYRLGRLGDFDQKPIQRWWVDCLFLALDRAIEDQKLDGGGVQENSLSELLRNNDFLEMSGESGLDKELATRHLTSLYTACGGRERFVDEEVRNLTALRLPDVDWLLTNDDRPQGAVHPTNPNVLKTIPRACAFLARYAGFETIDADELETFDPAEFVRRHTRDALQKLREEGVRPTMSTEDVFRITRER